MQRPSTYLVCFQATLEEFWFTTFNMGTATGLETFELHFKLGFTEDSFQFLESVAQALTTLPPSIRKVHLVMDFVYYNAAALPEMPWPTISRALNPEKYKKLENVALTIVDGGSGVEGENEEKVKKIIASQLPDVERLLNFAFID